MEDQDGDPPDEPGRESLLPYDQWTEDALRHVVARALTYAGAHGLPGDHHFYVTFRTDHPDTSVPARLRAQYPQEMTIVLQHQFWDLAVDEAAGRFSIGLSFGGVPSTLVVPLAAVTGFADPLVQFGLRFRAAEAEAPAPVPVPAEATPAAEPEPVADATPQVVSLDAFRRRPTSDRPTSDRKE